eukprot:SM000016S01888  [mRNA]  locus=s16:476486:484208:+ [translate_table: standard]
MAAQLRDGRLTVVELASGDSYIISSCPREKDTKLIAVDPTTGVLDHCGRSGVSVFLTEHDCLEHITVAGRFPIKSAVQGKALIGYAALGAVGAVLLATKTRLSIPSLPGGDAVHTVSESQWVRARLRMPHVQTKAELKAAEDLMSILIDNVHFYCETRDITRPFPSNNNVDDPDEEFVWNEWLSSPFKDIGLKHHCVVLLQGMAESRTFTDACDKLLNVALVARRSRMHPGTRYLARGLNAAASTGNEVECEQLVWQAEAGGLSGRSPFCTYVWRRGTVPIWWGAEIKTYVSEAEIFVSDKPYEGAATYYKRLQLRYGARSREQKGADAAQTPIYVLNLLRNGPGKPESVLTEHLHHSIRQIVTNKELPRAELTALNFDWHASTKAVGEARTVEDLWRALKEPTKLVDFTSGEYLAITRKDHGVIAGASDGQVDGHYTLSTLQTGVIRYNCADSLDRTNAASFFGGVQVLAEQCSRLGSSLKSMSSRNAGLNLGAASLGVNYDSVLGRTSASAASFSPQTSEPPALPPGWEMRKHASGQYFYIDHIRRVTTWTRPLELVGTIAVDVDRRDVPSKHNAVDERRASEPVEGRNFIDEAEPWAWFDLSVEALKARALAAPIAALAELFLIAGDIHALLYTGSKAMHSHIIQIFSEDPAKIKRANAASNVAITLQRRYLNMVVDSSRQRQLEAFLGLALPKICPSLALRPLEVLSRAYACLLKPVPAHFADMHPLEALLSQRTNSITWVCPVAADIVEIYIYLREPCHISALILTSAHGVDEGSTPSCMDVRAGQHLDDMQLLLEGASIPRCPAGTALLYNLAGCANGLASGRWHSNNKPFMLYNYEQTVKQYNFLTRVVAVTFYPAVPGVPMTLGQLEVLGASLLGYRFSPPSQASQQLPRNSGGVAQSQGSADASRSSTHSAKPEQPVTFDLLSGDPLGVQDVISGAPLGESSIVNPAGLRKVPQRNAPLPLGTADSEHFASRRTSGLRIYQNLVHKICSPQRDEVMSFSLALRLDAARLRLGLSSLEREQVLLGKLGKDPHSLDPNHLLSTPQEFLQVHRAAAQLSQLVDEDGQTVADQGDLLGRCIREDCEVGSGKGGTHEPITDVDESEYVQGRNGSFAPLQACQSCKRMACGACVAGTAGTQLVERLAMVAPASHASTSRSTRAHTLKAMLCWDCCPSLVRNALLLNQVRALETRRQACQLLDSAAAALSMLRTSGVWNRGPEGGLPGVPKELVSLAEHPYGALLFAVPTADGYGPAQSLLWRPTLKLPAACWQAPAGALSVDLSIVLSTPGILFKLAFYLVPTAHVPYELAVNMWTGNNVTERKLAGNWKFVNDQQHVVLDLESPIYCRIVSLRIEVQTTSISQSAPLLDLLSMDDMPPPSPSSIQEGRLPTLTLRRIVLLGVPDFNEFAALAKKPGSETAAYAALLETPPKFVRSRVQVEGEKSRAGGRIIELVIHPMVPEVAGFRLEALSCGLSTPPGLAQAAVYKDAAEAEMLKHALSDFLLATGSLIVHVSAVQDSRGPLPLGEFAVPVVRPGTSLCFDFPSPTSARVIILEVTGDVTGCPDESLLDHGDLGGREATVCGLSLLNKVRLYRYVHSGELGKWAQVNAP